MTWLRGVCQSFTRTLFASLPNSIGAHERLTRYIYSSRHFKKSTNTVEAAAFIPQPSTKETSMFRIDGLRTAAIWEIGAGIGRGSKRTLHARADLTARSVVEAELRVEPRCPPDRHAVIIGWPDDKDARMSRAQMLAAASRLLVAPSP